MSYEYDFLNYDNSIFDICLQCLLQNAFPEKYINSNYIFVGQGYISEWKNVATVQPPRKKKN